MERSSGAGTSRLNIDVAANLDDWRLLVLQALACLRTHKTRIAWPTG